MSSKWAIVTVAQYTQLVLAVRWNSLPFHWPCYAQVQRSGVMQNKSENNLLYKHFYAKDVSTHPSMVLTQQHRFKGKMNQSTQVDTLTEQVDTGSRSQNRLFAKLGQQVDTLSGQVDTRSSSQNSFFIIWAVCRHHHQGRSTHYGKFSS
ncbi:hypothetical protein Taro_053081 [Colocasia esculenta]|uniref:t-SNARE coiled-coil homology domain-containing protein n=1 Tax=Colocasia esculenta TaxID=4460 RepID=A0A843XM36_COLES|nr:hypothetical protein [Colocasia esculenta]